MKENENEQTTNEEVTGMTVETTETVTENAIETVSEQTTEKPQKRVRKRTKAEASEEKEIVVEEQSELEQLKQKLAELEEMKTKLEQEKNDLSKTVIELQEEVKITPQKLGKAIKEMGIAPLSMSRENPNKMTLETYNSMSDSQRREWQRKNRADFLDMMHRVKIS